MKLDWTKMKLDWMKTKMKTKMMLTQKSIVSLPMKWHSMSPMIYSGSLVRIRRRK